MLDKATLRASLRPLFDPRTMPREAVTAWVQAYIPYAATATAGGTLPVIPGAVPSPPGDFLSALDQAFRALWMTTVWAGPGLVGTTSVVPPLQPFLTLASAAALGASNRDLALDIIVEAVHTYTLSVTVSVVSPAGVPAIVPLA